MELDRAGSDDGTLVACGDVSSGFALFIRNGRLVWDYNMAWDHYTAMSESTLPSGRLTVAATFERTGNHAGVGRLLVNGDETASVAMPHTHSTHIHAVGISVGFTRAPSPSRRVTGRFPFTGRIIRATIDLGDDREPSDQALILD